MNSRTKTLSCKNCGGVLNGSASGSAYRCEYCHSISVVSDVPLLIDGIQPIDESVNSPCPSCSDCLQTAQLDGRPILYCPGCYGMLVRRDHFGAIVSERRSRRAGQEQAVASAIEPGVHSRRLRCPACEGSMETHPYYGPGNVIIDSCANCDYVWLDHGELSRVERSAGGREPANMLLPIDLTGLTTHSSNEPEDERNPLAMLADLLF